MQACTLEPEIVCMTPRSLGQVLVVEDNLVNQKVSRAMLQKLGYQVDIANNGLEGVEMWANGSYDAIIMDCQMPVLD